MEMNLEWRCPLCGKAGREDAQPGWRICANPLCRNRFEQSSVTPVEILPEFSVPNFPCPICGKESKEHVGGTRICAMPLCRHVF